MRRVVVTEHLTLDGVMQAPGRPDEDTRGGFRHGGWAMPNNDEVMARVLGEGMAKGGPLLFGRRTYEGFYGHWPHQRDNPFTECSTTSRNTELRFTWGERPREWVPPDDLGTTGRPRRRGAMRIGLIGIFVDDQDRAERFYTEVLGLKVKTNTAYGPGERWLTVVSAEEPDGVELVLHLTDEPARAFRQASRELGRPVFSLRTDDCQRDAERLKAKGVVFVKEPARMAYGGMDAVFDDTCGNLVNLHQD